MIMDIFMTFLMVSGLLFLLVSFPDYLEEAWFVALLLTIILVLLFFIMRISDKYF